MLCDSEKVLSVSFNQIVFVIKEHNILKDYCESDSEKGKSMNFKQLYNGEFLMISIP